MQRSTSTCKVLYLLYFFLNVLTMLVLCYVNPQIPNFPILIQHRPHKIVGVFCLSEHFWFVFLWPVPFCWKKLSIGCQQIMLDLLQSSIKWDFQMGCRRLKTQKWALGGYFIFWEWISCQILNRRWPYAAYTFLQKIVYTNGPLNWWFF